MHSVFSSCSTIILAVLVALVPTTVNSLTLDIDKEALRLLKRSIDPNTIPKASYISSWDFSIDPCESTGGQFQGILCSVPLDNNARSRITAIDLDSAGYDGFLAPSIGNLTELTALNLGRNNFRGPIPDSMSNLRKLVSLSMSGNFFTGSIPVRVASLKKLEMLDLSYNNLSGAIPAKLSGLRSLLHLRLSHNELSGRIPDLTGSWQLQTLELGSNLLYGSLPKFPVNLRTLSLTHNSLSGRISQIGKLQHLVTLDLSYNRFAGSITQEILTLPEVVHIDVSVNHLTAIEVPKFAGRETQLQQLDAQANLLRGHLPINLVTIGKLTSINLSNNQFSGPIPTDYGVKLGTSWRSLYLDHNFLGGNLPPQFGIASVRMRGSLANNCLMCPPNVRLCRGGQRPVSECVGQNDDNE
ncbi:hypothetical protein EZV62_001381 [Acer yangbiense]|uniref:Leucine-rich repeat-containing N-terminal plant-type domain-containing protein n=1 Tax=Acer yangbiense TaxID=1000413 RepID=A0A5C7IWB7_9ROSI|nr:hypothetical protein EZV62_001381 [Acer yangbiense]